MDPGALGVINASANELYADEQRASKISEPDLTDFIESVIDSTVENLTAPLTKEVVEKLFDEVQVKLRPDYVGNTNILDPGLTVVFEDGNGYSVVDKMLITLQTSQYWRNYKDILDGGGSITSDNPLTPIFMEYRFRILFLDILENRVHHTGEYMSDTGLTYFVEDKKRYIQQLWTQLSYIVNTRYPLLNLLHLYFDDADVAPVAEYISRERILDEIAVAKVQFILQYYDAMGDPLDKYQRVRLVYHMCPEDRTNLALIARMPTIKGAADVARAFHYFSNNSVETLTQWMSTPAAAPVISALREHAVINDDALFADFRRIIAASVRSGGARRAAKKTRRNRAGKRKTRKH